MDQRFHDAQVWNTEQMYRLSCSQMRQVWGGVRGDIWWHLLRGHAVTEPPAVRRSVGPSHVLGPELRTQRGAAMVAGCLLEKAGERLRHLGFYTRGLSVHVGGTEPAGLGTEGKARALSGPLDVPKHAALTVGTSVP